MKRNEQVRVAGSFETSDVRLQTSRMRLRWITAAAYVLPVLLFLHAVRFWGRGIVDQEALSFVINYLSPRSVLASVFDPELNDWGLYQARELSYVFDLLDARFFAALLDNNVLFFVPLSSILGLLIASIVYLRGATRVFGVDQVTAALMLSLFLSCIVTQASTPILYRSSKIILTVALLAFLFRLVALVRRSPEERASIGSLIALTALGTLMSLCDRQGFFYLVMCIGILALMWIADSVRTRTFADGKLTLIAACGAAVVLASLYNYVLAPAIIYALNGYRPDFAYQTLPFQRFRVAHEVMLGWRMFAKQVSYFFGNIPLAIIGAVAAAGCAVHAWRTRLVHGLIVLFAGIASLVALFALMILRHRPFYTIPDHAFWYYTLSVHGVFLFAMTMWVSALNLTRGSGRRLVLCFLLLAMVLSNVLHYESQRAIMIASKRWFRQSYLRLQTLAADFEGRDLTAQQTPQGPWIRAGRQGGIVTLPIADQSFLDDVRIAYATLLGRGALAAADGSHWPSLHAFLTGPATPLNDPQQIDKVLEAFRAIGIRRVVLHRDGYPIPEKAEAILDVLRASPSVSTFRDDGRVVTADLKEVPVDKQGDSGSVPITPESFQATASHRPNLLALAFDGNPGTRWTSGRPQTGEEVIRIVTSAPHDIARVRLDLTDKTITDYPRMLLIASEEGEQLRPLYEGPTLTSLMKGVLRHPTRVSLDFPLPPHQTKTLVVRQTGKADPWQWSVHEIQVWER